VEFHVEGGNETRGLQMLSGQAQITGEGQLKMSLLVFKPDSTPSSPGSPEAPECHWTFAR
jgi:hypothetical protein